MQKENKMIDKYQEHIDQVAKKQDIKVLYHTKYLILLGSLKNGLFLTISTKI